MGTGPNKSLQQTGAAFRRFVVYCPASGPGYRATNCRYLPIEITFTGEDVRRYTNLVRKSR